MIARPGVPSPPPRRPLSPREAQIALLVADGLPTKAIAMRLGISPWTVSTYLRRMYARFGVRSRAAMVARLFEVGLFSPSDHG